MSDADQVGAWLSGLSPWSLLFAVAALIGGWIAARVAAKGVAIVLGRLRGISTTARSLTARAVRYAIVLLALGIGLSFLGAPIQPLLAAAIIVGVVAALALRGVSDNFAAGIVLQTRRPIEIGDLVGSGDHIGVVLEMNGRSVIICTADGLTVHLPNSDVLQRALINYSAAGWNRSELEIRALLPGDQDREAVQQTIAAEVAATPGVTAEHEIQVLTVLDAPDRLTVRTRFWRSPADGPSVEAAVVAALAARLRRDGIEATVTSALPRPPLTPPSPV